MPDPAFFVNDGPLSIQQICELTDAEVDDKVDASRTIGDVASLDRADKFDLAFLDNIKYVDQLQLTKAMACLVAPKHAPKVPENVIALVHNQPYRAFAKIAQFLYPTRKNPGTFFCHGNQNSGSFVHASAILGEGVVIEPGAVVGEDAHIGSGTIISAGAVIGRCVKIGSGSFISANVSISHALIGDHVIIHPGAQIGQDGFGFAMGADFHLKIPQLGRVIIQDNVEIGANTTIDRGTTNDTTIGEGTKIDNLVQIAHNVEIGRHCIIVAQTGISGSARLGDFVALGGQVGVLGHITIGSGAQIAAGSGVMRGDVPPGERWGGWPAKAMRTWIREITVLKNLADRQHRKTS